MEACRETSLSESPGRSSWSFADAATAAAAWSARFIGTLNKAITASPMYLSDKGSVVDKCARSQAQELIDH